MFETILPEEIEQRSFAIIEEELGEQVLNPVQAPVIKRVIHTTADFDYVENLCFSEQAVEKGVKALKDGACIVTDTEMARAGINKRDLARLYELTREGKISPELVIGVPVGFVHVVEAKELFLQSDIPHIVARGRKGGSNVAAAICNALLYLAGGRTL